MHYLYFTVHWPWADGQTSQVTIDLLKEAPTRSRLGAYTQGRHPARARERLPAHTM